MIPFTNIPFISLKSGSSDLFSIEYLITLQDKVFNVNYIFSKEKLDDLYINPNVVDNKIEIALLSSKQYTDKMINELKIKESTKLVNVEIIE